MLQNNQFSKSQSGLSHEKIRAISLHVTNVLVPNARYDVCNPTLPVRSVLHVRFDVGLTIVNNTSYMEQTYIEVHTISWQSNKHMISVQDVIHREG